MSNNNFYIYLNGEAICVSEDVYQAYYRGERKERYFMGDLKTESIQVDLEAQTVRFIPSREDSYERLTAENHQYAAQEKSVEESALLSVLLETALQNLSDEERKLINELYYLDKTEREVSALLNIAPSTLHDRKISILQKLKKYLKNI